MAADVLSAAGRAVTLYERMPSVGRKFLMAGRGGLNLTHSESLEKFLSRYGKAAPWIAPLLKDFSPRDLAAWAHDLGQETFVGTSGRVFPKAMKASPLLRAWLVRLAARNVAIRTRHDWQGWNAAGDLVFRNDAGAIAVRAPVTILALGGASWPRLGANGAWVEILQERNISVAPLRPANCGFHIAWSAPFARFAGSPLKNIALSFAGQRARGEALITAYGIEGGAVYALGAALRDAIAAQGGVIMQIDLRPDLTREELLERLGRDSKGASLANHLRKTLALPPVASNLLRECHGVRLPHDAAALAACVKASPLKLTGTQSLARAISTAGGIALEALDESLMIAPGLFAAGEMLDWEAPTGGYLLQASLASGVAAAKGALHYSGVQSFARST
jgi:uncharacterized flavoprotein (TIGR03862 family)